MAFSGTYKKHLEEVEKSASSSDAKGRFSGTYEAYKNGTYAPFGGAKSVESTKIDEIQQGRQDIVNKYYSELSKSGDWKAYSTADMHNKDMEDFFESLSDYNLKDFLKANDKSEFGKTLDKATAPISFMPTSHVPFYELTDEEKAIYTYLHESPKHGRLEADEFIRQISEGLKKASTDSYTDKYEDFADEHPVLGTIGSTVANTLGGAKGLAKLPVTVLDAITHGGLDSVSAYNTDNVLSNIGTAQRNAVMDNIESPVGQFLYGTGTSMLDSAANMALFGGGSVYTMAMSAAQAKAKELQDAGADPWQVVSGSLLSGGIEALTESFSIDHFLKTKGIDSVGKYFKEIGKQALIESSEEGASDILNNIVDLAMGKVGGYSELNANKQAYISQGMSDSDATKQVFKDALKDTALSMLGGGLSGGLMGAPAFAYQWHGNAKSGSRIASNERVGDLSEQAQNAGRSDLSDALQGTPKNATVGLVQNELLKDAYEKATAEGATEEDKRKYFELLNSASTNMYASKTGITDNKGNALHVTGIKFKDDAITFVTDKGEYSADDVHVMDNSLTEMVNFSQELTKEEQKVFSENFKPDTNVADYINAFEAAYEYGKYEHESSLQNLVDKGFLTAEQAKNIYQAGMHNQNSTTTKLEQAKLQIANRKALFPDAKVRAKIDDSIISYDGSDTNKIAFDSLTDNQKEQIAMIEAAATAFNFNVKLFASSREKGDLKTKNGKYNPETNTIWLDIDAINTRTDGVKDSTNAIITTASHEMTHWAKDNSPELYNEFRKLMLKTLSAEFGKAIGENANEAAFVQYMKEHTPEYANLSNERVEDELIARACENMLQNSEVFKETLSKMDAKTKKTFVDKIRDILKRVKTALKNIMGRYDSQSNEYKILAKNAEAMDELQKKWDELITSAAENSQYRNAEIDAQLSENGVEVVDDGASAYFSPKTFSESEYVKNKDKMVALLSERLHVTPEEAGRYLDDVFSAYKYYLGHMDVFGYEENDLSAVVTNSEYGGSLDMSTICDKRRLYTGTYTAIQKQLKDAVLSPMDYIQIRDMLIKQNKTVTCGYCYVEGSRLRLGIYAHQFLKKYKATKPKWMPTMYDVTTPDGVANMRKNHPEAYEKYEYFFNHSGKMFEGDTGLPKGLGFGSQGKPKLFMERTSYKHEILNKFKNDKTVDQKNINGGFRLWSFSDFEFVHTLDVMQAVLDMSSVGLFAQSYTKQKNYAMAFGGTGIKINCSLIAKGINEKGELEFDDKEGMNHEDAFELRRKYSKNVGTVCVVLTDEQMIAALNDSRIDYVLPFHRSQLKKEYYHGLGLPSATMDATNDQVEKYIHKHYKVADEYVDKYGKVIIADSAENKALAEKIGKRDSKKKLMEYKAKDNLIMPNTYWFKDGRITAEANVKEYLRLCEEDGRIPKFSNLLVKNEKGEYVPKEEIGWNYFKLLIDFKMYDNEGNPAPQEAVKPIFNMDFINEEMKEYKGVHQSYPQDDDVVNEFVKDYKKRHKQEEYNSVKATWEEYDFSDDDFEYDDSISFEEDKNSLMSDEKYLSLIDDGKSDEARKILDDIARKHGALSLPHKGDPTHFYHGTGRHDANGGRFHVFDVEKGASGWSGLGFYFTPDRSFARQYAAQDKDIYDTYLFPKKLAFQGKKTITADKVREFLNSVSVAEDSDEAFTTFKIRSGEYFSDILREMKDGRYVKRSVDEFVYINDDREILIALQELLQYKKYNNADTLKTLRDFFGFDGVSNSRETVVWFPNEIKSANLIDYDDNAEVVPLSERFNEEEDDIRYSVKPDGHTYAFKSDFLKGLLDDGYWTSHSDPNYAHAYIAYTTPKTFLKLTAGKNPERLERIKDWSTGEMQDKTPYDIDKMDSMLAHDNVFKLELDNEDGATVLGHNGRHRMWQLSQKGVTRVPILIFDTRESEKRTKDVRDLLLLPQQFDEADDKLEFDDFTTIKNAVPFNEAYWDTIKRWFTYDGDEQYSVKTTLSPEDIAEYNEMGFSEEEARRMVESSEDWDSFFREADKSGLGITDYFYKKVHANAPYEWTGFDNMKNPSHWNKAYAQTHTETFNEFIGADTVEATHPVQVRYIGRTIDALDTNIDWSWLRIIYKENAGDDCVGEYTPSRQEIVVEPNKPNSLAHEMGHALDHRWGMDISGDDSYLTDVKHSYNTWSKEKKDFFNHFKKFYRSLRSYADKSTKYLATPTEIFARFVEEFVPWVEAVSTGKRTMFEGDGAIGNDYFLVSQYEDFVSLLQEKAAIDEAEAEQDEFNSWKDVNGGVHAEVSDFLTFEDYADYVKRSNKADKQEREAAKPYVKEAVRETEEKLRKKYEEAIAKLREEYKNAERTARENARKERLIAKILERTNKLSIKYNKHDKKEHIPEVLRQAFADLYQSVSMSEDLPKGALRNHLTQLESALRDSLPDEKKAMEDLEDYFGYDPTFVESIREIVDALDEKVNAFTEKNRGAKLTDLSVESLRELNKVLTAISVASKNYDVALGAERKARVSDRVNTTADFLSNKVPVAVKNAAQRLATRFFGWDNITPVYGYDRFGEGGTQTFKEFMRADDKNTANEKTIIDYANATFTADEAQAWTNEIVPVKVGGKDYKMTIAQIMTLYELNKRGAAQQHLYDALNAYGNEVHGQGIIIGEIEKEQGITRPMKVTREEVAEILKNLTDRQIKVADALQNFMSTVCADWGNYVTMMRYGIMQFGENDYFPMQVFGDKRALTAREDNQQASLFKLLNMGFTKSLDPKSNGALVLSSIFDVYIKHASEMAAYNAYALPILDTMKWLNSTVKVNGETIPMKTLMKDTYGADGLNFIISHIRDINGETQSGDSLEQWSKKLIRNYKTAATAANLRVVMMQPTAYLRAFNCIDGKYLMRALSLSPLKIKAAMDEMNEKSLLAQRKNGLGAYDANLSRTIEEEVMQTDKTKDLKGFKTKVMNGSLWLAQKMDEITWATLYKAVQIEAKEKGITGDAFDSYVNDRFEDICYRTQVFDSINARSTLMRKKDIWHQMATAFMSEPTLSYSMMANEVFNYMIDARGGHKQEAWAKHGKKIGRAFASFMLTAVAVSAVAALPDWLRDDDDETPFLEMYFKDFGSNMLAEAMGLLPWIKTIHSTLIEGYSPSRPDEDIIVSAKNAGMSVIKSVKDGDLNYRTIYRSAKLFSQMTGTPLGNVIRDFVAFWNKTLGNIFDMKIE